MTPRTAPLDGQLGYALEMLARSDCISAAATAPGRVNNQILWKLTRSGYAERVDDNPRVPGCRYRITDLGRHVNSTVTS